MASFSGLWRLVRRESRRSPVEEVGQVGDMVVWGIIIIFAAISCLGLSSGFDAEPRLRGLIHLSNTIK